MPFGMIEFLDGRKVLNQIQPNFGRVSLLGFPTIRLIINFKVANPRSGAGQLLKRC